MPPSEPPDDLHDLSDRDLDRLLAALERRREGALGITGGVRPKRQPWTYREIWRLERLRAEFARRRYG